MSGNDRRQRLYLWLGAVFVTSIVVADIIGGAKIFQLFHLDITIGDHLFPVGNLSVGMLSFPLTFVLTDLVNEFYGPAGARRITYVGLAMLLFTFVILWLAQVLPPDPNPRVTEEEFRKVFGGSLRLILASLIAYVVGQLCDIAVFAGFKRLLRGRHLWLRATGSTVVGQLVDTFAVNFINWAGTQETSYIIGLIVTSYLLKFVIAVALTPVIYLGHALVQRYLRGEPEPSSPP